MDQEEILFRTGFFPRGLAFFYSNRLEAYFHQAVFFRRENAIRAPVPGSSGAEWFLIAILSMLVL